MLTLYAKLSLVQIPISRTKVRKAVQLLLAVVAVMPSLLFSQTIMTTGALRGRVTDPSGAIVARASIRVVEASTSATYSATTDREGEFVFPSLRVGNYSLRATAPGFETSNLGITIEVGQVSTAQIPLAIGNVSQAVNVQGTTPLLPNDGFDTEHGSQSNTARWLAPERTPLHRLRATHSELKP